MTVVKFNRTIRQSGRSAAVAVPPELMNALNWKIGENVEIFADEEKLVIKKSN
jgi:antitoxin component of MazEF toxin-antitoxin module